MPIPEKPKLRAGLELNPSPDEMGIFELNDLLRISPRLRLSFPLAYMISMCDGSWTVPELETHLKQKGEVEPGAVENLLQQLEDVYLFEGPAFQERAFGPVRQPSCLGVYPHEPEELAEFFESWLEKDVLPVETKPPLLGILLPHMDYGRGLPVYRPSFQELVRRTLDVPLFIILATSHYSPSRFTLTRQDFATPLGIVDTDEACVDFLAERMGPEVFADPFAHIPEHSIELELVPLQHLRGPDRPFRIVPLLVGSFDDCVEAGVSPGEKPEIARMVQALKDLQKELKVPFCVLVSGDLAHIGPKFHDDKPVMDSDVLACQTQDEKLLQALRDVNATEYDQLIRAEKNRRRVCGYPPTWLFLEAFQPHGGEVLGYFPYLGPEGSECVSFAGVAFE